MSNEKSSDVILMVEHQPPFSWEKSDSRSQKETETIVIKEKMIIDLKNVKFQINSIKENEIELYFFESKGVDMGLDSYDFKKIKEKLSKISCNEEFVDFFNEIYEVYTGQLVQVIELLPDDIKSVLERESEKYRNLRSGKWISKINYGRMNLSLEQLDLTENWSLTFLKEGMHLLDVGFEVMYEEKQTFGKDWGHVWKKRFNPVGEIVIKNYGDIPKTYLYQGREYDTKLIDDGTEKYILLRGKNSDNL